MKHKHKPQNSEFWARAKAVCDGAFAIVLTLLAIEIKVPQLKPGHSLGAAILHELPVLAAFGIAGFAVWALWNANREVMELRIRVNRWVHAHLCIHLLGSSLIPWTVGIHAVHGFTPTSLTVAAIVFTIAAYPLVLLRRMARS